MTPPKPANDETPPLWPGLSKRAERRIWLAISWTVLVVIWGGAALWLDARHWIGIGMTIAVGFVVMLAAGLWRLLIGGRS